MSPRIRPSVVVLPALVVALAACSPTTPSPEETYVSGSEAPVDPAAAVTPNPIEPDTVLIVRATVTAANGAALDLELQVHRPTSWDYAGTLTLPAALIEDCAGTVTQELIQEQQWSFTRVNVTAIPTGAGIWPEDESIGVSPSAQYAMIAGREMLAVTASGDGPACFDDKSFAGPGRGALAVGVPGDATALVGWARHTFGFSTETGALSNCSFELTELGAQSGGGSAWAEIVDDSTCVIGAATETNEY